MKNMQNFNNKFNSLNNGCGINMASNKECVTFTFIQLILIQRHFSDNVTRNVPGNFSPASLKINGIIAYGIMAY
jgi:hypothetical protein